MRAYSVDLREKIIDAVLRRGIFKEEAARTFGMDASSVKRYVKKAEEWTEEQLTAAASLEGASMPNGQKYEGWLKSKGRGEDGANGSPS
jgi:transposase